MTGVAVCCVYLRASRIVCGVVGIADHRSHSRRDPGRGYPIRAPASSSMAITEVCCCIHQSSKARCSPAYDYARSSPCDGRCRGSRWRLYGLSRTSRPCRRGPTAIGKAACA